MKPADVAMEPVAWTTADGLVRQCQVFRSRHLGQRDMLIAGQARHRATFLRPI